MRVHVSQRAGRNVPNTQMAPLNHQQNINFKISDLQTLMIIAAAVAGLLTGIIIGLAL
jgi:hypothetical protein